MYSTHILGQVTGGEPHDCVAEYRAAAKVARGFFPAVGPALPGFDISGAASPARGIGGDFFLYTGSRRGGCAVAIGDVCGMGFAAGLHMAGTRALLRSRACAHHTPGEVLDDVNHLLRGDLPMDLFVTAFLLMLEPQARTLTCAGAGHNAHLLPVAGGSVELESTGMPLGIAEEPIANHPTRTLHSGDVLLLMTDGVTDSRSPLGEFFGTHRALAIVHGHRDQSSERIVQTLLEAAEAFRGNQPQGDDMTAVVIKALE